VLFLVDSFNALARAYNELDISAGGKTLVGGMESKTLYYLKKFLGSARNLKESGSLTMLGALTKDTGNPVDDLLVTELCSVSNLEIHLSEELALCHIYPNIDLAKTRSVDARYPNEQEEDNYMLCNYLRHEYLPLYPLETLSSIVQKAKTYEEVYNKAMKAVREAKKSGTA
jgi:transcription termination factor Rho